MRYWASTSRLGTDTAFSEDLLKIGRKLVTKLWNAANLVAKAVEGSDEALAAPEGMEILDRWIISRLHHAVKLATEAFERFEYAEARVALEDFFWNDFCDNYLELVKARAYEKDASALITLQRCLHGVLKLFAPFIPHVTEEIYTALFQNEAARTGFYPCAQPVACSRELSTRSSCRGSGSGVPYLAQHCAQSKVRSGCFH